MVSSRAKTLQVSDGDYRNDYFRSESEAVVSDIVLVNSRTVKMAKAGVDHYALVRMEKQALVQQQQAELKDDVDLLTHELAKDWPRSFDSWWALKRLEPRAERLKRNLILLSVVDQQESSEAQRLVRGYHVLARQMDGNKKLRWDNRTQIDGLNALVSRQLAQIGVEIASGSFSPKSLLSMHTEFSQQKIGREVYLDATLSVRLVSAGGSVLAERKLNESAVVMSDVSLGLRQINRKFYRQLKDGNLLKGLLENAN
jgi:hypothetical protein